MIGELTANEIEVLLESEAHGLFGEAAEQGVRDSATAVRAHHDQVDVLVLYRVQYFLPRRARGENPLYTGAAGP